MSTQLINNSLNCIKRDSTALYKNGMQDTQRTQRIAALALAAGGYIAAAFATYFIISAVGFMVTLCPLSALVMLVSAVALTILAHEAIQMGVNVSMKEAPITEMSSLNWLREKVDASRPRTPREINYMFKNTYMAKLYDMWPSDVQAFLRNPNA
jgi:hypothetical protein